MSEPATAGGAIPTVPLTRCPLCGASDFRSLPFAYLFEGATFPGGACRRCGLRGLLVQPAATAFGRLYARDYFAGGDVRCGHVGDYFADRTAQLNDGAALARVVGMRGVDPAPQQQVAHRVGEREIVVVTRRHLGKLGLHAEEFLENGAADLVRRHARIDR